MYVCALAYTIVLMDSIWEIIGAVMPPFLLMIVGGFSRKKNWIPNQQSASLSRFIVCVLYPCFILNQVLSAENAVQPLEAWATPLFGFGTILAGFGIARMVAHFLKLSTEQSRAFSFCSGIFNYGFFAIPVASLLFGDELVVKIILFNLGVEIAIWTVGILVLTSSKFQVSKLFNPPALSVFLALGLQALDGTKIIPQPLWELVAMIGQCSIPLGLMVIGAAFYDLLKGYRVGDGIKIELGAVLSRNLLIPAVFVSYAAYGWMPASMGYLREVLVVQAAMPAGVFALLVVNSYGQRSDVGLRAILATMLACLITLPWWVYFGLTYIVGR